MDDELPIPMRIAAPEADLAERDAELDAELDLGGDPACWAALVCPNCGAIPDRAPTSEPDGARHCPSCGEAYPID
jgi:hypothetical protein